MGALTLTQELRDGRQLVFAHLVDGRAVWGMDTNTREEWWYAPELADALLPELRQLLVAELQLPRSGPAVDPVQPSPDVADTAVTIRTEQDWYDLAANVPGQAARARAEEELVAMKARSRVGTWLARAVDAKTDERAWRVGADGEEAIGSRLDKLTKHGWYVLHAVPVGNRGSDIDHVVIGPGGVFTVNTKKHPGKKVWVGGGTVMVNGQRVPYIRNSEFEADRAEKLLSRAVGFPVLVKPVLIFTTGTLIPDVTIKKKPDRVIILDRMDVPGAFKRADGRLDGEQVDTVYAAARRSTTWT